MTTAEIRDVLGEGYARNIEVRVSDGAGWSDQGSVREVGNKYVKIDTAYGYCSIPLHLIEHVQLAAA